MIFASVVALWALMGTSESIPPCTPRVLPVDLGRLHATRDVQAVNVNETNSVVTVLFQNGDVLRMRANDSGCTRGLQIYGRYWSDHLIDQANATQKAKYITDLIFSADLADKIDRSIQGSKLTIQHGQWYFDGPIQGDAVWFATLAIPFGLDGMGRTMSITYMFPSGNADTAR